VPTQAPTAGTNNNALSSDNAQEQQNAEIALWLPISLLLAACLIVGFFLWRRNNKKEDEKPEEISPYEKWMIAEEARKRGSVAPTFADVEPNGAYRESTATDRSEYGIHSIYARQSQTQAEGSTHNPLVGARPPSVYGNYQTNAMNDTDRYSFENNPMAPGNEGSTHNPLNADTEAGGLDGVITYNESGEQLIDGYTQAEWDEYYAQESYATEGGEGVYTGGYQEQGQEGKADIIPDNDALHLPANGTANDTNEVSESTEEAF
jgi:hypothetical protein